MQCNLFEQDADKPQSIGLKGGELELHRGWLESALATEYFNKLAAEVDWQQPEIWVAGQRHKIPRLQAWYGDENSVMEYSATRFYPTPWSKELISLKDLIENKTESSYNSVLVNLYRNGADGVGWHADDEKELGGRPVIASLSLGASRSFSLKPKAGGKSIKLELNNGDLIVMKGDTQRNWLHAVAKTSKKVGPRINLTFRYIFS